MQPVDHPKQTRVFGKPADWDEKKMGSCGGLSVYEEPYPGGAVRKSSLWKPSDSELEMLKNGACVELGVYSHGHPAVSVGVNFLEIFKDTN